MAFDQTLFGLYSLNFFTNVANSILAPFYPDEALSKGVTTDIIGYIFSSHPVFSFLVSLLIGKQMKFWGRKKILVLGLLLQSIGLATFGAVIHVDDKLVFIVISLLARIIQGIGFACYGSIAYAYLPLLYPETVEKKISYMEILTGVGLMLGPLIGGLLYSVGGYECPFYFMAGFFFLITPVMLGRLPLDKKIDPKELLIEGKEELEEKEKPVSIAKFFFNKQIFMTFIIVVIPNAAFGILQPTFTKHMHDYTNSTILISVMFSIGTFAYAFSMPIMSILPKRFDRRIWLMIGLLLSSISGFFLGPETLLNLPHNIVFVIIGISILGVGCAFSMVPSIPEFMHIGHQLYPEEKEAIGDMSSGLFNSAYSAGALIGPIAGGYLESYFGFARAESFWGIFIFCYLILYMTLGGAFRAFKSVFKKADKMKLIEEEEKTEDINPILIDNEKNGDNEKNVSYGSYDSEEVKKMSTDISNAETKYTSSSDNRTTIVMSNDSNNLNSKITPHEDDQFKTVVEDEEIGEK